MGFFLSVFLLALTYVRPWDFFPSLTAYRLPFWTGNFALLFAVTGFLMSRRYDLLAAPAPYLLVLFFAILIVSPVLAAGWFGAVPIAFTMSMANVLSCLLIMLTARTPTRMRVLGCTIVLLSLWLTLQSALAYHGYFTEVQLVATQRTDQVQPDTGQRAEFGRVVGTGQFNDANDLAQALIAAAPLLWPAWRRRKPIRNFLWVILPTGALLYGVFLTKSRGAIVTIAVVVLLRSRETMKHLRSVGPLFLAASFGAVLMASGFSGGRELGGDASTEGRIEAWYEGIQMLRSSPIVGVGFGLFTEHHERAAHNAFVHCFAELGLLGYFAWIGLLVAVHTDLYDMRTPRSDAKEDTSAAAWATAIRFSLYAYLAGAFFLSRTYASTLYMILGLGMAMADIGRHTGRLGPHNLMGLAVRTTVVVVGSIIGIYLIVKVS